VIQYQSLPYPLDAQRVFEAVRDMGDPVLLDSSHPASSRGRYDIISAAPDIVVRLGDAGLELIENGTTTSPRESSPFALLESLLADLGQYETDADIPFNGGFMGIFSYDLGRAIEQLPSQAKADIQYPWLRLGRYLWAVVIDHQRQRSCLMRHPLLSQTTADQIQLRLQPGALAARAPQTRRFQLSTCFESNLDRAAYGRALNRIDDYIHAGDCYQINFTQRFSANCSGDPWQAYQALSKVAPTPFAACLESDDGMILSLSPERFIEVSAEGKVETRPIKGTRPRGAQPDEDRALAKQLLESAKDRAENLMIVDLLRNDLSKSCLPGSVEVPELFSIEHYPNVHHMVSSVRGVLRPGVTSVQLLRDCFPGGSITGAPKIRAMEIIDELEPHRRSVYCGSIGYISSCGRMDTNITIRTLLVQKNRVYCWAGGGIVADSDIDDEYQECFNKVNNLLQTLEGL